MKEQDILHNIAEKMGITQLNEMQQTMADISETAVALVAPTGSGKTLAFTIAALKNMDRACGKIQTVVIAPSRELVLQIYEVIRPLATGYKTVALYGGHDMHDETNSLLMTPDIIVATPGRLVDHIARGQIRPGARLATLVLDEYDKSLELGFAEEMKRIIRFFMAPEHVILTSATRLEALPEYFPRVNPRVVDFTDGADGAVPAGHIHTARVASADRDKLDELVRLISSTYSPRSKTIVFVNHRESAERVWQHLRKLKIPAGLYHGGLEQPERENAIALLNNGTTPILVSTDLASRGLDIDAVDNVIHYHLPVTTQAWTHRNGRTGRQGAEGNVYVITTDADDIPDYVTWDNDYYPAERDVDYASPVATLYLNLGKKEKISRGDIMGFLIAQGGLEPDEIGVIDLKDHRALVAVPADKAASALAGVAHQKIKNRKVKVTRLK